MRVAEGAQDGAQEGAQAEQAEEAETAEKANEPELTPEEKAKAEAVEWKDKYIRLFAEFDNYKKRTMKEKAELILNGGEKTITALLPVLDDFERALADKGEDATAVREGFQLIMKKLEKILEGLGVRPIDTKDKDSTSIPRGHRHGACRRRPEGQGHRLRADGLYAQRQSDPPRQGGRRTII